MIHLHVWQSLRRTFPIRKSEWAMAFATVAFWLVLSLNPHLFENFDGYDALAARAPQWFWAWFCFVIGVGRVAALFVNGAYWRSPHARAVCAFINCYLWYQMTMGFSENLGVAMIFAGTFFVIDALNFKQAFVEAAASEGMKNVERKYQRARHTQ